MLNIAYVSVDSAQHASGNAIVIVKMLTIVVRDNSCSTAKSGKRGKVVVVR